MTEKNKGGRPRLGDRAKTAPLNMRTSADMRAKIAESANLNGWSMTQEVEYRIRRSFEIDDKLGRIVT